jgi:hypothetical protein
VFVWTCYRGCTPGDIRADLIRAKGARRLPPRSQRQPGSHQPRPVPADQRDYIIGIIIDPDLTPADAKLHIAVEMLPGGKMPLCRKELDDLALEIRISHASAYRAKYARIRPALA